MMSTPADQELVNNNSSGLHSTLLLLNKSIQKPIGSFRIYKASLVNQSSAPVIPLTLLPLFCQVFVGHPQVFRVQPSRLVPATKHQPSWASHHCYLGIPPPLHLPVAAIIRFMSSWMTPSTHYKRFKALAPFGQRRRLKARENVVHRQKNKRPTKFSVLFIISKPLLSFIEYIWLRAPYSISKWYPQHLNIKNFENYIFGNVHKFCIFIDTIKLHCRTKKLLWIAFQWKFSKAKLRANK